MSCCARTWTASSIEMRVRVEQALLDDAGARVRLERMRVADERLKAEIPLPALEPGDPLSTHILDGQPMPRVSRPALRWGAAVVALAAGISGVIVGFVLLEATGIPRAPLVASAPSPSLSGASSNAVARGLDTGESGKAIQDGDRSAQVIRRSRLKTGGTVERSARMRQVWLPKVACAMARSGRWLRGTARWIRMRVFELPARASCSTT